MKTLEERLMDFVISNTGALSVWRNSKYWSWGHIIERSGILWTGMNDIIREADEGEILLSPNPKIRKYGLKIKTNYNQNNHS